MTMLTAQLSELYSEVNNTTTFPHRVDKAPVYASRLVKGDTAMIANSFGGTFDLEYQGEENGLLLFYVTNPDFDNIQYRVSII